MPLAVASTTLFPDASGDKTLTMVQVIQQPKQIRMIVEPAEPKKGNGKDKFKHRLSDHRKPANEAEAGVPKLAADFDEL